MLTTGRELFLFGVWCIFNIEPKRKVRKTEREGRGNL